MVGRRTAQPAGGDEIKARMRRTAQYAHLPSMHAKKPKRMRTPIRQDGCFSCCHAHASKTIGSVPEAEGPETRCAVRGLPLAGYCSRLSSRACHLAASNVRPGEDEWVAAVSASRRTNCGRRWRPARAC